MQLRILGFAISSAAVLFIVSIFQTREVFGIRQFFSHGDVEGWLRLIAAYFGTLVVMTSAFEAVPRLLRKDKARR